VAAYRPPLCGKDSGGGASRTSSVRERVERVWIDSPDWLVLMEDVVAVADSVHKLPLRARCLGGGASRTPLLRGRVEGTWMGSPVVLVSLRVSCVCIVQDNKLFLCLEDNSPILEHGCSQPQGVFLLLAGQ
jgi:hypothetical protein